MAVSAPLIFGAISAGAAVYGMANKPDTPQVIASSPIADQSAIDAEAAAKAAAEKTQLRRRLRASSLLATGGEGDPSRPLTSSRSAVPGAKSTLGA